MDSLFFIPNHLKLNKIGYLHLIILNSHFLIPNYLTEENRLFTPDNNGLRIFDTLDT